MSLPTAVTASTGMPNFPPSSTSLAKLTRVSFSNSEPTKIDSAMAETFKRMQLSMETVISSLESSLRMLVPPETRSTTGFFALGMGGSAQHAARQHDRIRVRHERFDGLPRFFQAACGAEKVAVIHGEHDGPTVVRFDDS